MARIPFQRTDDADAIARHVHHPSVPCARCGCAVFHYELRWLVRLVDNGASLATPDEVEPPHLDMGYIPVCVPCAPSIPEPFRCNAQDARGGF